MDFFRADTDTDVFSSVFADTDFLETIFGADTAFAPSSYDYTSEK